MHAVRSHAYRRSPCGMRRCPRRERRARADHQLDLRVAYFGAPLITSQQAKAVPLGITRRELFKRLPRALGECLAGGHSYFRTWKICIVYPVKGTGIKYTDGFVSADEWEFCFGFDDRLNEGSSRAFTTSERPHSRAASRPALFEAVRNYKLEGVVRDSLN